MDQKVLNQIKFLCKEIPKVEWSGVLFYKVEGSIKDPENMRCVLLDILPLHKGTSTYTEYEFDFRIVDHIEANPELEDASIGHIHSHNTMGVFFSGTDWSELEDNAPNHNLYLSLIINNFMDFCAKICFIAKADKLTARDEKGLSYLFNSTKSKSSLVVYDCEIQSPNEEIKVENDFKTSVSKIIQTAEEKQAKAYKNNLYVQPTFVGGHQVQRWTGQPHTYSNEVKEEEEEEEEIVEEFEQSVSDFAIYILNIENSSRVFGSVLDTLKYFKNRQVSGNVLAKAVLNFYASYYTNFWSADPYQGEHFNIVTKEVIQILEDERDGTVLYYVEGMLNPVITGLKKMLENFNKEETI